MALAAGSKTYIFLVFKWKNVQVIVAASRNSATQASLAATGGGNPAAVGQRRLHSGQRENGRPFACLRAEPHPLGPRHAQEVHDGDLRLGSAASPSTRIAERRTQRQTGHLQRRDLPQSPRLGPRSFGRGLSHRQVRLAANGQADGQRHLGQNGQESDHSANCDQIIFITTRIYNPKLV